MSPEWFGNEDNARHPDQDWDEDWEGGRNRGRDRDRHEAGQEEEAWEEEETGAEGWQQTWTDPLEHWAEDGAGVSQDRIRPSQEKRRRQARQQESGWW